MNVYREQNKRGVGGVTQCKAKNGEVELLLLLACVGWLRILKTSTNCCCCCCGFSGTGFGTKQNLGIARNPRFETGCVCAYYCYALHLSG